MSRNAYICGDWCFMLHPSGEFGKWARTHKSVAYVQCPACGAKKGEFCINKLGERGAVTHDERKKQLQLELFGVTPPRVYAIFEQPPGTEEVELDNDERSDG
jgi:hypothetical protein